MRFVSGVWLVGTKLLPEVNRLLRGKSQPQASPQTPHTMTLTQDLYGRRGGIRIVSRLGGLRLRPGAVHRLA